MNQVTSEDVETFTNKGIRAADKLDLEGDTTSIIGTTLLSQEGGTRQATITGDDVEDVGSKKLTSSGKIDVISVDDLSIQSTGGNLNLKGIKVFIQDGTLRVARDTDPTLADSSTDSAFFTFLSSLVSTINTFFTTTFDIHTHMSGPPNTPTGPPTPTSSASVPSAPSSLTGKIDGGDDEVFT